VRTLADAAVQTAHQHGERKLGMEGDPPGRWILVDLGDVVVHLFEAQAREFYSLERLWDEGPRVELPEGEPLEAKAAQ
jgi:ribosome-associated protein